VGSVNFEEKWEIESLAGEIFENNSRANFQVVACTARYNLMARVLLIGKETPRTKSSDRNYHATCMARVRTHACIYEKSDFAELPRLRRRCTVIT